MKGSCNTVLPVLLGSLFLVRGKRKYTKRFSGHLLNDVHSPDMMEKWHPAEIGA